jgi:hypothetical protein
MVLGLVIGIGSAIAVVVIIGLVSRGERQHREFVRAVGTVQSAYIRQIVGHGLNVGMTFEIKLATGAIGESYGGLGGRGYDMAWLSDAFATGKPVEIMYHPEGRTVLIRDPRTGQFL